jgi:glycosyltransferase involved in cell wall biosynthesis
MEKILIIVPSYNESKNITFVLDSLKNENAAWDIAVINDCSLDDTGELARKSGKAMVINLPCNLGIGGAVQAGFKYAKKHNYDIAVQFDGDGQHVASEVNKLLLTLANHQVDVVIGSRFSRKHQGWKSTRTRRIGIRLFALINSFLIGQPITDNTSGFRAYNKKAINFLANFYPIDFPEPEAVILLGKNDFKIMEVYTEMQERKGGKSSIFGVKSAYYMIKVIVAILISSIKPKIQ